MPIYFSTEKKCEKGTGLNNHVEVFVVLCIVFEFRESLVVVKHRFGLR
jgi:hypothetical protein